MIDRRTLLAYQRLVDTVTTVSARSIVAAWQWPVFVAYLMRTKH